MAKTDTKGSAHWLPDLLQDVRRAVRSLIRTPGFSLIGILTIALGVGATTAVFSLANALLFRPLTIPGASRVLTLNETRSGSVSQGPEGVRIEWPRFEKYRDATSSVFTSLVAHQYNRFSLSVKGAAETEAGALVSRNYFDVLGLHAQAGSFFTAQRDPVIVISDRLWRGLFAADRAAVGSLVLVDGASYTVIGVAPPGFIGTSPPFTQDLWVPIDIHAGGVEGRRVGAFGRLQPGMTTSRAQTAVTSAALRIKPEQEYTKVTANTLRLLGSVGQNVRDGAVKFVTMLLITSLLVLLIAASNLAGMQLTRASGRRREIAVQVALGAGRSRLVRQLLTESVVLFLAGGIGGILVAFWATRMLSQIDVPISAALTIDITPDVRVLAFALAISAVSGIIFGIAPALASTNPDLVSSLKDGSSGGTRSARGRSVFVVGQVAVAVLLLVVAGLFVRSLQKALRAEAGFDPNNVVVGDINLSPLGYDGAKTHEFFNRLQTKLRGMRDVQRVGFSQLGLLSGSNMSTDVSNAENRTIPDVNVGLNSIDTAFIGLMKMKIVAGRNFTGADRPGAPRSVIINEAAAKALWPGTSPIGHGLKRDDSVAVVVGVVSNAKYNSITEDPHPYAFYAIEQDYPTSMTVHVRSSANAADLITRIRREVNAIEPAVAVDAARPMNAFINATVFPQRFAAGLVGIFGLIGLFLAALGVYGVLAFQVAQRTREFGIRVAIGAQEGDVLGGVLRMGVKLAIIGAVIGLALAFMASRLIRTFLFGINASDPLTFIAVPVILMLVAMLASYIPARRATRIPPTQALRTE